MSAPESSAGSSEAREDACRDYQSSLEDLTFNSKPHINMLTILAEENVPFAKDIVSLIEAQIAKAPASEKLPVMYLMDSIVKNVGREYLTAFTKNLVATFICVFEKVDENTRKSLFKLRSTWDDIFPLKKLYALDVRVNSLDPAWPIKPLPPNVNTSSIHVNPKFLNKSPEESTAPTSAVTSGASTPPAVPEIQKNLTQEQLIRQQLLAKQKQLLELQQKKLELELEQTKAQLAVSLSVQQGSSTIASVPAPSKQHMSPTPHMTVKPPHQTAVQSEKNKPSPSPPLHDIKIVNRDPRLNRMAQHSSHAKDQSHRKEFAPNTTSQSDAKASKTTQAEKQNSTKQEKLKASEKTQKKELDQSEAKSKSPSPLKNKLPNTKDTKTQECESTKVPEISKRDPRLKRHLQDKSEGKEEDVKEKRRNTEKKEKEEHKTCEHRPVGSRNKVINGAVQKQDTTTEESEKQGGKQGRSSSRKRSRSRSPKARSPSTHSPKRRERRSPKRRLRSLSPTSSTPKIGKIRQIGPKQSHVEEGTQASRDERNSNKRNVKQEVRDPRRVKKAQEDRPQETASQHSTKAAPDPKENAENWQGSKSAKRWKSGWEENKNSQQNEEHQALGKSPHQRHRENWPAGKGILSPRAPKQQHRLSVDANLQIPKELTSASKRELLKKANERLTSGEITQDEFLMVAHQIRQLFQYQEGKHRCVREEPRSPFSERFKRARYEDPEKAPFPESPGSRFGGIEAKQRISALMEDRPLFDGSPRPAAARVGVDGQGSPFVDGPAAGSSSRIDGPPGQAAMRFEGPLVGAGASQFDGPLAGAGGAGALRFDGPPGQLAGALRFEGPPGQVGGGGPLRFEGPLGQIGGPLRFEGPAGGPRFEGPGVGLRFEGPRGQPSGGLRFEGPHGQPMGPRGQPGGGLRFEGPHGQPLGPHGQPGGGLRFEGPHLQPLGPHSQPGGGLRFEGPHGQPMGPHGPSGGGLRFEGPHGPSGGGLRLEGPHGQPGVGPRLIDGPVHQGAGGLRFDGPLGRAGPRFDGCHAAGFDGQPGQLSLLQRFDGIHGQPGPRFERAPGQQAQPRFDTAIPQRFDGPHQPASRFDLPLGLQGARFENVANHPASRLEMSPYGQGGPFVEHPGQAYNGPSHGMQFQRPDIFDGSPGPNFNGPAGPGAQNFPLRAAGHYFDEKSLQGPQYGNFNNMPMGSNQVSLMSAQPGPYGQGQQYLPNPGSFVQNPAGALPHSYPDNHLGQLDVNELFAKLLSTGILKLSKTDSTSAQVNETSAQPAAEEEDDDQNEDQNVPDLTNFIVEELRQRYDSVINRLYTGIQCYSCGMRFTTSQTDVYADHLDWHYRQNRTEKDVSRKITHRRWYYSLTDWIEFEEIADLEERAKSQFFEKAHEEVVLKTQEAAKEKEFQSVPAGPAGAVESCEICQEQFEQYWDEEEEEWHLKNAIRVDEKIYHPSCYEDYQNTSSFDCTPSPSKTPVENPLNIMLNIVKQETQESCDSPKVKEEPDDTPTACAEESTPASTDIKTEPEESV
ncbi:pre-mRNA cleavage complex 2 protein Pcf11 isoform X4 [Gavia stellata]|uniref:pre-mRNA cleavage complex 2 protein Pcf11 isoform X4 n=1 Tax=Gavia stellata TaxID=37040 RepID=UPI00289B061F|nr:pre-mRNA cleavage complex 2 protein Pcf11 isoform X4 [Gavia stellata]